MARLFMLLLVIAAFVWLIAGSGPAQCQAPDAVRPWDAYHQTSVPCSSPTAVPARHGAARQH